MNTYFHRTTYAAAAAVAATLCLAVLIPSWDAKSNADIAKSVSTVAGSGLPADTGFFVDQTKPVVADAEWTARREARAARLRAKAERAHAAAKRYLQFAANIEATQRLRIKSGS